VPDEVKSREQLEKEWWDGWYAEDYSWDGLARKLWTGWVVDGDVVYEADTGSRYGAALSPRDSPPSPLNGKTRKANLQDYWRADPATGKLRSDREMESELAKHVDQPTYHRCHLPLRYRNGAATAKGSWTRGELSALVEARLRASRPTKIAVVGPFFDVQGADHRAQFQGAVWTETGPWYLRNLPAELNMTLYQGYFENDVALEKEIRLGVGIEFSRALLRQFFLVYGARFAGSVHFNGTRFLGTVSFRNTNFIGPFSFSQSTSAAELYFEYVNFQGSARFRNSDHYGALTIKSAEFHGHADFSRSTFHGGFDLAGASFSSISSFDDAVFAKSPVFAGCTFDFAASFSRSQFASGASFKRAVFRGTADFSGSEFKGSADFKRAQFKSKADFRAATFEKPVSFQRIEWPESQYQWHGAFNSALFRGAVTFAGAKCRAFAAFDGARFESSVYIDEEPERSTEETFDRELAGALTAAMGDTDRFEREENERRSKDGKERVSPTEKEDRLSVSRVNRLNELEGGCRTLRRAMESAGNRRREQLFYRLELRARRAQKALPRGERFFSWLYDTFSSYGASMTAPLVSLGFLLLAFTAIYGLGAWALDSCRDSTQIDPGSWSIAWESLVFSLKNAFLPFSALAADKPLPGRETFGTALLFEYGSGIGLAVRALGTLQSLLALTFAFLFALALRRRFQIS
jgi:uncharacterized protein YjbI with pentapeptide repeats